jgi:hypothetical protein
MPVAPTLLQWITSQPAGGYLLVLALNLLVTVIEIISVFEQEAWRAVRTWGAFLLMVGNGLASVLVFDLIRSVAPETPVLPLALTVGFGLSFLIRTRLTLLKPLPQMGQAEGRGLAIPFDVVYDRWQRFCRRYIDRALATRRVQLARQALNHLTEDDLLAELRLLADGGFIVTELPDGDEPFFQKVAVLPLERRKVYLAFTLMDAAGPRRLQQLIEEARLLAAKGDQGSGKQESGVSPGEKQTQEQPAGESVSPRPDNPVL